MLLYRVTHLLADQVMLTSVPSHIEVILRRNWCQHNLVCKQMGHPVEGPRLVNLAACARSISELKLLWCDISAYHRGSFTYDIHKNFWYFQPPHHRHTRGCTGLAFSKAHRPGLFEQKARGPGWAHGPFPILQISWLAVFSISHIWFKNCIKCSLRLSRTSWSPWRSC